MTPGFRSARLCLVVLAASAVSLFPSREIRSQEAEAAPIEGAWKLIVQKNGDAPDYQKPAEGSLMIKFVTGGRFIWTVSQGGKIVSAAAGTYKIDKDKYSETIESVAGEGQDSIVGKTFDFTWKMDGKTWLHVGTIQVNGQDMKIDEKWERCSKGQ
jgi:hypothetical protein